MSLCAFDLPTPLHDLSASVLIKDTLQQANKAVLTVLAWGQEQ